MRMIRRFLKKYYRVSLIFAAGVACLSMSGVYFYDFLSFEDLEREHFDRKSTPALSSSLDESPYWESFNEWHCYSTKNIRFECTELDYGLMHVPTIRIADSSDLYDYSMDPEPDLDCEEILGEWKNLMEGERSFCVHAAYLQNLPYESYEAEGIRHWSLWILEDIKTSKGYWKSVEMYEVPPTSLENI